MKESEYLRGINFAQKYHSYVSTWFLAKWMGECFILCMFFKERDKEQRTNETGSLWYAGEIPKGSPFHTSYTFCLFAHHFYEQNPSHFISLIFFFLIQTQKFQPLRTNFISLDYFCIDLALFLINCQDILHPEAAGKQRAAWEAVEAATALLTRSLYNNKKCSLRICCVPCSVHALSHLFFHL